MFLKTRERLEAVQKTVKSVHQFANVYATKESDEYEEEVVTMVLNDLRVEVCELNIRVDEENESLFERDLAGYEHRTKVRIWLDAVVSKTGFIPLQFPGVQPQSNDSSPPSTADIKTKAKEVFSAYSRDLEKQTNWAIKAMGTVMQNSGHLSNNELKYTKATEAQIEGQLRKLVSDIWREGKTFQQETNGKYSNFREFSENLKEKLKSFEDKWNAMAAEEFRKLGRVSGMDSILYL